MGLDMFFQILGSLEGLATEFALVRLQRDVNADVRGDVVTLDGGGAALAPGAGQVEVVGRLAADMTLADMFLVTVRTGNSQQGCEETHIKGFWRGATLTATLPLALQVLACRVDTGSGGGRLGDSSLLWQLSLLLNDILRCWRVGYGSGGGRAGAGFGEVRHFGPKEDAKPRVERESWQEPRYLGFDDLATNRSTGGATRRRYTKESTRNDSCDDCSRVERRMPVE